ncbi:MAG TPA: hypothetical protein VM344_06105 [Vitreimonas sp.]|nr:hypothetical protein [Vitreimonas sp.]
MAARMRGRRPALILAATVALAACGGRSEPTRVPVSPASPPAAATPGPAAAEARASLERALGERRLLLQDPQVSYRPAESPVVAQVPRTVYQAVLPDDPGHGYIVVYEFPDEPSASSGADAQAAYVASPVGRVQFPVGTDFIVRRLGRVVLFYAEPPHSPDDQAADVGQALRTIGTEVTVPS